MKQWISGLSQRKFFLEGMLVLATLSWGLSFIWAKQVAMSGINMNAYIAIRHAIAMVIMLPFCLKELKTVQKHEIISGILIGAMLYGGIMAQTVGLKYTSPASSGFITTCYVVFVPFTSWLMLKEKPKLKVYFSVALCVAGLYVLTVGSGGDGLEANLGSLLTLICAIIWSFQVSYVSKAGQKCRIKMLALLPMAVMVVIASSAALATGGFNITHEQMQAAWQPMLMCAIFPSVIAGMSQAYAQKYISPSRAAIIYTLESVFALVFSVLMGMEHVTAGLLCGGGLILGGILISEVELKRKPAAPADN